MNATKLKRFNAMNYKHRSYNNLSIRERNRFKNENSELWKWICKDSYTFNEEGC